MALLTRHRKGHIAEIFALWVLRLRGWQILERRWSSRLGEIDIIAKRGRVVIFVEVKVRANLELARNALTHAQWQRIEAAADLFMAHRDELRDCSWRFDAICVTPWRWPHHIQNMWE